jgi:hypothetical protein
LDNEDQRVILNVKAEKMDSSTLFLIVADLILVVHLLFVGFVVVGLVLIFVGKVRRWAWVLNPWFRVMHLLAIGVVVVQSWIGVICPLTTFEMALRSRAGDATYTGSFVSHGLERLLYYQLPAWVFAVCYTAFGLAVVSSWFWVRPRPFTKTISDRVS